MVKSKIGLDRIQNAILIIKYAIDNGVSIKAACVAAGYSGTYVKNTKIKILSTPHNFNLAEAYDDFFKELEEYIERRDNQAQVKPTERITKAFVNEAKFAKQQSIQSIPDEKAQTTFKDAGETAEFEFKTNSNYPIGHIKSLGDLLKAANVDEDVWNVKDFVINKWDVTSMKYAKPITVQNFQVKARLERKVQEIRANLMIDVFKDMVKNYKAPLFDNFIKNEMPFDMKHILDENNLLEISIFDLHLGKLAWHGETGENYDTKIAKDRFLTAIKTLLYRANGFYFNRILFPVGNDFFNSDNLNNTTTHGTPQDEDLRWQKTYKVGVTLLVDAINTLKQTGVPVDVMVIPGNHDFERSFYMGEFLSAWFRNDKLVNIDNGASPRKYYNFGEVLLGFTHGSEEKIDSLPLIMANDLESKPFWSKTKFHEWHIGHQHRKKNTTYRNITLNEDLGVTVRQLSSLTGTEEWHHKKGFIGQVKAADGFVWNDKLGLIAHLNSNLKI